jgi:hypothetical protein
MTEAAEPHKHDRTERGRIAWALMIPVFALLAVTLLPPSRAMAWLPRVGAVLTLGAMAAIAFWHPGYEIRESWRLFLLWPPVIIWSAIGMAALIYRKSSATRLSLITGILVGALAAFIAMVIFLLTGGCAVSGECL